MTYLDLKNELNRLESIGEISSDTIVVVALNGDFDYASIHVEKRDCIKIHDSVNHPFDGMNSWVNADRVLVL